MKKLTWGTSFRRTFKRHTQNNPKLKDRIFQVLDMLAEDPFHSLLKTHKLSGPLKGLWACWVEYDCRIIFAFEPDPDTQEEMIVLIDLDRHDEVY